MKKFIFNWIYFVYFIILIGSPIARAEIAEDSEINGRVALVKRTLKIQEEDCLRTFRGLSCEVKSQLPDLIGGRSTLEPKVFYFNEGNIEQIRIEFIPRSNGYSVEVYPGNAEGPFTGYVRKVFKLIPGQYEVRGLRVDFD